MDRDDGESQTGTDDSDVKHLETIVNVDMTDRVIHFVCSRGLHLVRVSLFD